MSDLEVWKLNVLYQLVTEVVFFAILLSIILLDMLGNERWHVVQRTEIQSRISCIWSECNRHTLSQECKANFLNSSCLDRLVKTSENDIDNALPCDRKFVKANENEMSNSVEVHNIYSSNGGYKPDRQDLTNARKNHSVDSFVILSSPGVASILTLRRSCHLP